MKNNGVVVALGTFDGLHRGHMSVLNAALSFNSLTPVAVTFLEPPKRKTTDEFVPMLLSPEEKLYRLRKMGFEDIFVLDYDEVHDLSSISFLDMLFQKFNVKAVVCGFNYRFGKGGQGDALTLSDYCRQHNAESVIVPDFAVSGQTVSSSRIRKLIKNGDVSFANMLLGYSYSFTNEVIHGEERGRKMGFPTVNIPLDENLVLPKFGVYASSVVVGGKSYAAVTNIGIRPTFLLKKPLSETYIIDFDGDIYGETVTVELLKYIREEKCFDGLNSLKQAIEEDKKISAGVFRENITKTNAVQ
ncbi:MAG: bifunctional riboflavin kinase/FAD synthetase [Clostridia bacterium]|nr:bifunctional riboflavin kinase/FAD synthetase [Clostridia bacterium]